MFERFIKNINKKKKRTSDNKDIDIEEMERLLEKGAILVDVRSPQEYRENHLDKAILLPEYEILARHKTRFKNKEDIIVLYCSNGTRSKKARKKLEKLGYTNVYILNVTL